jgi:hypothetical protein
VESKYSPADLNKIVAGCNLLSTNQQEKLHKLLKKFAHLFNGTLGNWKTNPVDLELKDRNEKPYHAKPYLVPHSLKNNSSKMKFNNLLTLRFYGKQTDLNGHALCSQYLSQISR